MIEKNRPGEKPGQGKDVDSQGPSYSVDGADATANLPAGNSPGAGDAKMAMGFLEALGFDLSQEEPGLEVRILGKGNPEILWPGKGRKTWPKILRLNAGGANIYFGVCPRRDRGRNAKATVRATAAWCDLDGCSFDQADPAGRGKELARERLRGAPIQPSAVVDSGRGLHIYYLLDRPLEFASDDDRRRLEALNQAITTRLGGDSHATDVARILRLPGTSNMKDPSRPLPCLVESINPGRRYALEQLEDAFPTGEGEAGSGTSGDAESKPSANWLRFIDPECVEEIREGDREPTLRKIACAIVNHEKDAAKIEALLLAINARCCKPPRDEATCKRLAEQVVKLYGEEERAAGATALKARIDAILARIPEGDKKQAATALVALSKDAAVMRGLRELMDRNLGDFATFMLDVDSRAPKRSVDLFKKAIRGTAPTPIRVEAPTGDLGNGIVLLPADIMGQAREVRAGLRPNVIRFGREWLDWLGGSYRAIEAEAVRSETWLFLEKAKVRKKTLFDENRVVPFNPVPESVSAIIDAVQALAHRAADRYAPPCWLEGHDGPPARALVSMQNGLLHLPSGELMPPTPGFFTRNSLGFAYDPAAPEPTLWLKTLKEWWPRDDEADNIDCLQELFGYNLVPDVSQQRAFLIQGVSRSGKGTIGFTLQDLVGIRNCCFPRLQELAGNFGLQPLLGKSLAIVSDMRLSPRDDRTAIAENMLRITAGESVSVSRKNTTNLEVPLRTRFLLLTNPIPAWGDASGTVVKRLVVLRMQRSFEGKEDVGLADKLRGELPGIFLWAVEGWRRLRERGRFVQPESGKEIIRIMSHVSNPVAQFAAERCDIGERFEADKSALYGAYRLWHGEAFGNDRWLGRELFFRSLYDVAPGTFPRQAEEDGVRTRVVHGIRLRPEPGGHDYGKHAGAGIYKDII